jgi:hypothetical protein
MLIDSTPPPPHLGGWDSYTSHQLCVGSPATNISKDAVTVKPLKLNKDSLINYYVKCDFP